MYSDGLSATESWGSTCCSSSLNGAWHSWCVCPFWQLFFLSASFALTWWCRVLQWHWNLGPGHHSFWQYGSWKENLFQSQCRTHNHLRSTGEGWNNEQKLQSRFCLIPWDGCNAPLIRLLTHPSKELAKLDEWYVMEAGVVQERTIPKLQVKNCWWVGTTKPERNLESAQEFNRGWCCELVLGVHDCRHYTLGTLSFLQNYVSWIICNWTGHSARELQTHMSG